MLADGGGDEGPEAIRAGLLPCVVMVLRLVRTATVEGDKVAASFKNDVLTIPVPESAQAQGKTRRIPINGGSVEH